MLYNIKLENDLNCDLIEAEYADDALNTWLLTHKDYWIKNVLSEENYKQLDVDINGIIYDIDIQLKVNIKKLEK